LYKTVILQKKREYMSIYGHILYVITYVTYIYIYSYMKNYFLKMIAYNL